MGDSEDIGLTGTRAVVASDNYVSATLDEEEVILKLDSEEYYGLNDVGTYIWNLVQEPTAIREIERAVEDEYHVSAEECRQDIQAYLESLLAADLIRVDE